MKDSRTHVANIRVDIRAFATVYLYFIEKKFDEVKFSKGKAISLAFKFFERLVVEQHPEYEFVEFSDAVEFLTKEGIMDLTKSFINKSLIIKELQKESLVGGEIDPRISIKAKIQKSKKDLPSGILSKQSLESIKESLDQKMSEGPETIIKRESLAKAEEGRREGEKKEQEALDNFIKEKRGEQEDGKE